MAVPKTESDGRARGQMLPSPAWAWPRGLQPVAVAQNRADALGLLWGCLGRAGEKNPLWPSPREKERNWEYSTVFTHWAIAITKLRAHQRLNSPNVVKQETTGSPLVGREAWPVFILIKKAQSLLSTSHLAS